MATLIYDVNDLQDISLDLTADYELANDIAALGFGFVPLGTFTGILDAKNYVVTDLTITLNAAGIQQGALIRVNQGTVKNLGLVDCAISVSSTNDHAYAAGIALENDGGTIQNCYLSGSIFATSPAASRYVSAGGLVNLNYGAINDSYTTATVKSVGYYAQVGGLVCSNELGGTINRCLESGNVEADAVYRAWAGGFCAFNSYGTIDDAYARGASWAHNGTDFNYAAGFVTINQNTGIITNAYSTGVPTAITIGGFCVSNTATITDCFWDTQTSGTAVSDGGTGKTTAQMKQKATFSGWSIGISSSDLANGYPFLGWQSGGSLPWYIYATYASSPRETQPVEDKIPLEAIRNIEMSAAGRVFVDKSGNFHYDSRQGRRS